jgi:hypothetical protein
MITYKGISLATALLVSSLATAAAQQDSSTTKDKVHEKVNRAHATKQAGSTSAAAKTASKSSDRAVSMHPGAGRAPAGIEYQQHTPSSGSGNSTPIDLGDPKPKPAVVPDPHQ